MAVPSKKAVSDFPTEVLATQAAHQENISELTDRIRKIEQLLDTPIKMADFFDEKSKDSRRVDEVFAKMFCRFIKDNEEVKAALCDKIQQMDRNFFFKSFKRFWLPIYTAITIVATIVLKALVEWGVSLIPHAK